MPPMPGVSFHTFPKSPKLRRLWVLAMKRDCWQPTPSSRLCSAHFRNEDYVHDPSIALRMGIEPFTKLLKPGVIPSVFEHNRKENKLRGAFVKRQRKEASGSSISMSASSAFHSVPGSKASKTAEEAAAAAEAEACGDDTGNLQYGDPWDTDPAAVALRLLRAEDNRNKSPTSAHATPVAKGAQSTNEMACQPSLRDRR
ncbi:hypothetical protein HPB49_019431 [Dermacentor silvarum]|uniref:Uncharacterized protein n=1 Tax=Dermacentor silvarum TaxID=543639 RepID=A0ACB8C511_DERSI|nr:hypothetical protein HPB49_019431 [Dermacentor silvarum]